MATLDVNSLSELKTAVSTLSEQLSQVITTASQVDQAGQTASDAYKGTDTAASIESSIQPLHDEQFENAKKDLENYIDFLNKSFTALEQAEATMSKSATNYANTGGC